MRPVRAIMALLIFLAVLTCAGCGSKNQDTGAVYGSVLDAQGKPVAQATVLIEGKGQTSQTDSSGFYRIDNVPVGSQKVTATKAEYQYAAISNVNEIPGYTLTTSGSALTLKKDNKLVPLRETIQQLSVGSGDKSLGSVVVGVKQGVKVMAEPIVLIPQTASLNNLVIYQAEPIPGGDSLVAGKETVLQYDIAYKTNEKANLVLFAYYESWGTNYLVKQWKQEVQPGSGERIVGGQITIPERLYIDVMAALITADNRVLGISALQPYAIAGGLQPRAPFLRINAIDNAGIGFSWQGGNTANFKGYEIQRNQRTIAAISQLSTNNFVDTSPLEGQLATYKLVLITSDSQRYESNPVTLTVRRPGFSKTTLNKTYKSALVDPSRGYIYFANALDNTVYKYSKDGKVINTVPVCSLTDKMAIHPDGSMLAVTCSGAVAFIDLDSFTVIRTVYNVSPRAIAFRPKTRVAYACDNNKGIWEIDIDAGTAQLKLSNYYSRQKVSFSPDGSVMYLSTSGRIAAVDITKDYTETTAFVGDTHYQGAIPDPSGDVVYIDNASYAATTTMKKNDFGQFYISGVNKDGTLLFGSKGGSGSDLQVFKLQGDVFTRIVEFGPGDYENIIAMDITSGNELVVVLSQLRSVDLLNINIDARL